jgi:hypothetical protein
MRERGRMMSNPMRARLRRLICIRVERERSNPGKLSAREHGVDELHPVNRIAARVDDEQVRVFLARIPHLRLACAHVDVVAGRPRHSHKLGSELPVNDKNDAVSHRGRRYSMVLSQARQHTWPLRDTLDELEASAPPATSPLHWFGVAVMRGRSDRHARGSSLASVSCARLGTHV